MKRKTLLRKGSAYPMTLEVMESVLVCIVHTRRNGLKNMNCMRTRLELQDVMVHIGKTLHIRIHYFVNSWAERQQGIRQ